MEVKREDVRFDSAGESCAGWLFRPAEAARRQVPCVVLCNGFSCVRDQGLDRFGERFARAGLGVLAFDYRHFGDSGGEPRLLARNAGQRQDMRSALAFARRVGWVDSSRIAAWGYSLGGGHVQSLAASEAGIAAAVCIAPMVNDTRSALHIGGSRHAVRLTVAALRDGIRGLRGAEPYRIPIVGAPGALAAINCPEAVSGMEAITPPGSNWRNECCPRGMLGRSYELERKARTISCPTLYCIAEDDQVNPPELGKRVAKRVPDSELCLYPGGHFDFLQGETFERVVADQVDFLTRRLIAE